MKRLMSVALAATLAMTGAAVAKPPLREVKEIKQEMAAIKRRKAAEADAAASTAAATEVAPPVETAE